MADSYNPSKACARLESCWLCTRINPQPLAVLTGYSRRQAHSVYYGSYLEINFADIKIWGLERLGTRLRIRYVTQDFCVGNFVCF